jgi:2-polyprenyl-6-methoxyphenol hydroxylase-like FAD-dependent oxidoreductase
MPVKHVVVIGGSVAGLGVALALSARGQRVTILEADATPLPASHQDAFERWDRRGSPQARHSHALLARLRNLIRDHAPDLLEKLLACGAEELRFTDRARQLFPDPVLEPGDADVVSLACRRITFEWVLRRHVLDTGLVDFRDGVEVTRLAAERDAATGLPRVTGVYANAGGAETLVAGDLVVDASGRRSKLKSWLPAIGTKPVREASSPCGIFYTSRFYRLLDGATPPPLDGGIIGVDLGYLKVGIFAGDSRVFSITLAASPTDAGMRRVLRQPGFDAAVAAIPLAATWTSPALAEPVSDVHGMANLQNTRRWLVEDGEPLALGFVAVGDAQVHTNPIVGRGCSLAWTSAFDLAGCLAEHGDDLRALALAYHAAVERNVVPWYEMQLVQDADAIAVAEAQQRGEDPYRVANPDGTQNPKAFIRSLLREGLVPALAEDLVLLRIFIRAVNLLDSPRDLLKNPVVMQSLLASYAKRDQREKVELGPPREAMLERFAALGVSA